MRSRRVRTAWTAALAVVGGVACDFPVVGRRELRLTIDGSGCTAVADRIFGILDYRALLNGEDCGRFVVALAAPTDVSSLQGDLPAAFTESVAVSRAGTCTIYLQAESGGGVVCGGEREVDCASIVRGEPVLVPLQDGGPGAPTCTAGCGDGTCDAVGGETTGGCPDDCGGCGDVVCDPAGVGLPCTAASDCATPYCLTADMSGWPQGYCSAECNTDSECGTGNHCVDILYPGRVCLRDCTLDQDCQPGHGCADLPSMDGRGECVPVATGSGTVGAACTSVSDCAGGPCGWCFTETMGAPGGYCVRLIGGSCACPSGTHLTAGLPFMIDAVCLADCATAADCRTGGDYVCTDTGVSDSVMECWW